MRFYVCSLDVGIFFCCTATENNAALITTHVVVSECITLKCGLCLLHENNLMDGGGCAQMKRMVCALM